MIVPRTCTEISTRDADQHREQESQPLEAFLDAPAYVLLGDPGAGKTTAFEAECEALGDNACLITARDFLTFDPQSHPEWQDKILFIDGLDEIRVGADDTRTPFDQIRGRLDALGKPHFRLSCREADWLGANDRRHLESVSPDSKVTVLRLNPLTDSDIADILNARPDIGDAQEFIALAQERRVYELLKNPQTLEMLADVVAQGGGWPKSRKETFEMACGQIVREHNEEHQAAQESNSPPAPDQLLDAAGRLCAVQLISGAAGYTNTLRGQPSEGYPTLDQFGYDSSEMLRPALATKLFKGVSNNRFAPVHRHIAEFLGARYLAGIINSGLPARRVIALIEGKDGTVVTEMRGLSAWLAAHCEKARSDFIKRDPIGVGLYGDIREFSTHEKRALLKALYREGVRLRSVFLETAPFGALATPDMEPVLEEILADSNRIQDSQMFTEFVLDVLTKGEPLPSLSELLLKIVRYDTWWPHINTLALDAFIHNCPNSPDKTDKLKALLADIRTGIISDPDNELFGVLLIQLYPQEVPPSEMWNCLSEKGNSEFFGRYWRFWDTELLKKSSDEQVVELLDYLQQRLPDLQPVLDVRDLNFLPSTLLARGLKAYGDQIYLERLCAWLDMGFSGNQDELWLSDEEAVLREIRSWLEQRPEIQKAVFMEGLARCSEIDEFREHASNFRKRLYDASPPSDFGLWCLKQAVAGANTTKPRVAEYLLEWAVSAHKDQSNNEGLSLEVLHEHTQRNETLTAYLDRLLAPPSIPPQQQEWQERDRQYAEERRQQEEQWLEYIRSNEAALRENRAVPYLLYRIALRYFGDFINVRSPGGPRDIEEELRDPSLIDAALLGIRGVIDREDVPDIEEILALREKGHWHYLGYPFLAALAEIERTAPEEICRLTENQMRKALAFHYWLSSSKDPNWYQRLLNSRPSIVADVLIQSGKSQLRGGNEHISGLFALAHREDHSQVAKHASLPLLYAFPTRCKLKQIQSLDYLLWAALQYADRTSLQELIEKKLSRKSMNNAQRVHWLAAGIIVSPRAYNNLLRDFVEGHERRTRRVLGFFYSEHSMQFSIDELGIASSELLIRLVGSYVGSDQLKAEGWVTPEVQAALLVNDLIQRLAASPAKDASDALGRLLADPALSRWHDVLSQAQDAQQVTWRDASYRHPTIEKVCQTLNGGNPANAADLAALVMDRLDAIARKIRGGPTSDWRQYWNVDQYNRPTCEKPEDACRDNLLSDLQNRLEQLDIDAQPEGRYTNDKRSDIRVYFGGSNVPVEIKKNSHQKLWSALRDQLITKYTSTPGTDGYGIYLVFWFGKDRTPPPPSGTRPANAKELQERLEATLSPDEARKISICVIDVSRPD